MILKQTDDYTFEATKEDSKILLHNNVKNRYEIWIRVKPGQGNLIWCWFEIPCWYTFDHIATDQEMSGRVIL